MKALARPALGLALALLVPANLAAGARAGGSRAASTLTVFAAASLADAFTELGRMAEREHPGLAVKFNFAGSQQLAAQIEQGADADVFASADGRWMDYARQHDWLAGPPQEFARNRLVVIVPRTNPARIGRLEDLARGGIKFVIGADAVPVGHYSRQVLRNLADLPGFPRNYATRALANVVSEEENVKSVVAKIQLGEADAGFVYRSDAAGSVARYLRILEIPDSANVLASYPIAIMKRAANPTAARAFVDLLLSPAGQRVLASRAFVPVTRATP